VTVEQSNSPLELIEKEGEKKKKEGKRIRFSMAFNMFMEKMKSRLKLLPIQILKFILKFFVKFY
jgi:hypothetical protein